MLLQNLGGNLPGRKPAIFALRPMFFRRAATWLRMACWGIDAFKRRSNALTVSTLDILHFLEIKVELGADAKERQKPARIATPEPGFTPSHHAKPLFVMRSAFQGDLINRKNREKAKLQRCE